jgi:hypothetical protein
MVLLATMRLTTGGLLTIVVVLAGALGCSANGSPGGVSGAGAAKADASGAREAGGANLDAGGASADDVGGANLDADGVDMGDGQDGGDTGGAIGDAGRDGSNAGHDGSPPLDGGQTPAVLRTLVHHQVTVEEHPQPDGITTTNVGIALSRDGKRAVYVVDDGMKYDVTIANLDGSGRWIVDRQPFLFWNGRLAISEDGALVAYAPRELRVASPAAGSSRVILDVLADISCPRIARDPDDPGGWRVYFFLANGNVSPPLSPGVYSIKSDGTGIRQLITFAEVAAVAGGAVSVIGRSTLDVSKDGKRFVAGWATDRLSRRDVIIAGTTDGAPKRVLVGPLRAGDGLQRVAISGDGSTVAYDAYVDSSQRELGVIRWDGTGHRKLGRLVHDDIGWGLSDDGARLLADRSLHDTDGGGSFELLVRVGQSLDPLVWGAPVSLDRRGDRVLSIVGGSQRFLSIVEINPASTGAAPAVTAAAISPAVVKRDGPPATVSARVSTGGRHLGVGTAVLLDGRQDRQSTCVNGEWSMWDDGRGGDAVAGDGIFSRQGLSASRCASTGVRSLRVQAQSHDAEGRQHATAVDIPLAIE